MSSQSVGRNSVIINTLNEELNIADCIRSAQGFADEFIVCDMHSDDHTVEIAANLGARVIFHERTGYVEPARHYAISHASYEWVLVLDADERMTEKLAARLKGIVKENRVDVVMFGVLYNYFGGYVWHGGFFKTNFPRFFRKTFYLENYMPSEAVIHQNFRTLEKIAERRTQLPPDYYILHEAYPTIEKYIQKTVGMYARLEAKQRVASGGRFSAWRMLGEPVKEFVIRFFRLQGFRDGWRGFILAVLFGVFRFTVWANIWFLTQPQCDIGKQESKDIA